MSESSRTREQQSPDPARWLGLGFIVGVVVAVIGLEYYGYIYHPTKIDEATVEEFSLLSLEPEYEVRVSPKPSGKEAFCVDGYLLLRPENGGTVAGILVDSKERPIACKPGRLEGMRDNPSS